MIAARNKVKWPKTWIILLFMWAHSDEQTEIIEQLSSFAFISIKRIIICDKIYISMFRLDWPLLYVCCLPHLNPANNTLVCFRFKHRSLCYWHIFCSLSLCENRWRKNDIFYEIFCKCKNIYSCDAAKFQTLVPAKVLMIWELLMYVKLQNKKTIDLHFQL